MRSLIIAVTLAAWPLVGAGCNENDAAAEPHEVRVPHDEVETGLASPPGPFEPHELRDPVTPDGRGGVEPSPAPPLMPPDLIGDPNARSGDPTVPEAEDQLERDRVEEAHPQGM